MLTATSIETRPNLVYVVDDDPVTAALVERCCRSEGFETRSFKDGYAFLEALNAQRPAAVCLDLWMKEMDGFEVLRRVQHLNSAPPVVILTSETDVETAVRLMRLGAFDFQTKPLKPARLLATLRKAIGQQKSQQTDPALTSEPESMGAVHGLVGNSLVMQKLANELSQVAQCDVPVMLVGESGTGKELVARAIHTLSARRERPFVAVNCGAIPNSLIEGEFFGHERGAFTGAQETRKGHFENAHNGTLFLDETVELSTMAQVRLLRVLQEGKVSRVGSSTERPANVRIIGATNQDIEARVDAGEFRLDLFYRMMVYPIHLPPLRERLEDVPALVAHFIAKHGNPAQGNVRISDAVLDIFLAHEWRGNVRELENVVRYALVRCGSGVIREKDLPASLDAGGGGPRRLPSNPGIVPLKDVERETIEGALEAAGGNVSKAARRLGLARTTLYRKITMYGIR